MSIVEKPGVNHCYKNALRGTTRLSALGIQLKFRLARSDLALSAILKRGAPRGVLADNSRSARVFLLAFARGEAGLLRLTACLSSSNHSSTYL